MIFYSFPCVDSWSRRGVENRRRSIHHSPEATPRRPSVLLPPMASDSGVPGHLPPAETGGKIPRDSLLPQAALLALLASLGRRRTSCEHCCERFGDGSRHRLALSAGQGSTADPESAFKQGQ